MMNMFSMAASPMEAAIFYALRLMLRMLSADLQIFFKSDLVPVEYWLYERVLAV